MPRVLGILITSERHGVHLEAIAAAARRKNIELWVHISGPGVRLCLQQSFQSAIAQAKATICQQSAMRFSMTEEIVARYPHMLTGPHRPPLDLNRCHRRIVL